MAVTTRQILLLSDNARSVACLEGTLTRGQFRLHRLAPIGQLEKRLPALLTTIDGAIVDGTAPQFSSAPTGPATLESTLMALDRHQLGSILLTGPEGEEDAETRGRGDAGRRRTPGLQLSPSPRVPVSPRPHFPLVWPVPADRLDLLGPALQVVAGFQQVVRQLQREIRLFQRVDLRLTGQFNELDEEMRLAGRIQRDFLPKLLPAVGPARFATLFRPAGFVSGDLYDVFRLDEGHIGFYIVDAVGHGMPAALLTMFIKRSMETKQVGDGGYRLLGPEETLGSLNWALLDARLSANQFTTAVYAVLDVQTLRVDIARGGHPHPIWLHRDGSTSEPEAEGGLLGVLDDAQFARSTIQLAPGDKLLLYSDGLEAVFTEDDKLFNQLYRGHIEQARLLPIDQMLSQFVLEMDRQAGSLNPRDDVTVIGLEIAE